ncbi:unnamed protein product [Echinostoma caproni]|uniref:Uncharacterized protein n=1 Tax=Echinostoma caproni TaxID=27848 RepID=A0A183B8K5_9TREM|nr:unnamed protein product [Echinostoma caproni]
MDFPDSSDQKSGISTQKRGQLLGEPRVACPALDGTNEQRDLERRRQLLNRRRRLRQIHPGCQSIVSCCYRFGDCLQCRVPLKLPEVQRTTVPNTASSDQPHNFLTPSKKRRSLFDAFRMCRIGRQRDKTGSATTNVQVRGSLTPGEQSQFTAIGLDRSTLWKPLDNLEDEEFEVKTLSMQLQKPVAYVANAESDGRSKHLVGSCLHKVCATCGCRLQLSSNACVNCRKPNSAWDSSWKDQTGAGDCPYSMPNRTPTHLPVGVTCAESVDESIDPGFALTQSSMQILDCASARLGAKVLPEKLFNTASMMHLLHPKLKQICYPRSKLIEHQRLSKRAFGWIILAEAPNLDQLIRRHRMLSLTTAERLGLTPSPEPCSSHANNRFGMFEILLPN